VRISKEKDMDDFRRCFPKTLAMVESLIAAQDIMKSAQHIHQQPQGKTCSTCGRGFLSPQCGSCGHKFKWQFWIP